MPGSGIQSNFQLNDNDAIITINAGNVTLDFADHYIVGPTNASATFYGVYSNENGSLLIENGTVSRCCIGVLITGHGTATSSNNNQRIQNMLITHCSYEGMDLESVNGADLLNNRVGLIGGTTTNSSIRGIYTFGTGIRITGHSVSSLTAAAHGTATGIEVDPSNTGMGGFVFSNQISGATYGIIGGKYQQNLTDNCTTPMSNGTDAGLND